MLVLVSLMSVELLKPEILLSGMTEAEDEAGTVSRLGLEVLGPNVGVGVGFTSRESIDSRGVVVVMPLASPVIELETVPRDTGFEVIDNTSASSPAGPAALMKSGDEDSHGAAIVVSDDVGIDTDSCIATDADATADAVVDSEPNTEVGVCIVALSLKSDSGDEVGAEETGSRNDDEVSDTISVGLMDVNNKASLGLELELDGDVDVDVDVEAVEVIVDNPRTEADDDDDSLGLPRPDPISSPSTSTRQYLLPELTKIRHSSLTVPTDLSSLALHSHLQATCTPSPPPLHPMHISQILRIAPHTLATRGRDSRSHHRHLLDHLQGDHLLTPPTRISTTAALKTCRTSRHDTKRHITGEHQALDHTPHHTHHDHAQ